MLAGAGTKITREEARRNKDVSRLRTKDKKVCCVTVSDLHLTEKAPLSRAEKGNWLGVTKSYLDQIKKVAQEHEAFIVYGGDIFDKWNVTPSLINWALDNLPFGYAVPGQHDLPLHNYLDIKKSAYWTLCRAGLLVNLSPGVPHNVRNWSNVLLHGFPWKSSITPIAKDKNVLDIAVIHSYIWTKKANCYPGAPVDKFYRKYAQSLRGYDVAVFGDNHKGFIVGNERIELPTILNNGGFMRRKSDEVDYQPCFGLIYTDGTAVRIPFTGDDCWVEMTKIAGINNQEIESFVDFLKQVGENELCFQEALRRYLVDKKIPEPVQRLILETIA